MDLTETVSIVQAYKNLWGAIQDIDTPVEAHPSIKYRMTKIHAQIPSKDFDTLADSLPGYNAFQVRVQDTKASKFPKEPYDTGNITVLDTKGNLIFTQETMTDSQFKAWKRRHGRHLKGGSDEIN